MRNTIVKLTNLRFTNEENEIKGINCKNLQKTNRKTEGKNQERGVIKTIMLRMQSRNINDPMAFHARSPLPCARAHDNVSAPTVPAFPVPYHDPPAALAE